MQRLVSILQQAPVLLVLDNLHRHVDSAVEQLLDAWSARHEGSLLLATAWSSTAFGELHRHLRPQKLQVVSMTDIDLVLQQPEAAQLLKQHMISSRRQEQQPDMPAEQLQFLAVEAAAALRFHAQPAYTPQVLRVCGRTLGIMAEQSDAVQRLQRALRRAQEVAKLSSPEQLYAEDHIFDQLRACYSQLSESVQQTFVDLHKSRHLLLLHGDSSSAGPSLRQLALWIACHQPGPCSESDVMRQVDLQLMPAGTLCSCMPVSRQLMPLMPAAAGAGGSWLS